MTDFRVTTPWNPANPTMAFAVGWVDRDRRRHVWISDAGQPGTAIYCNPVDPPGRYDGRTTRKLDAGARGHAATMAALKAALPRLTDEAKAMYAREAEEQARKDYKAECDRYVDRVNALSPVAASWVLRRLAAGRGLDELKLEIRNRLEGVGQ